MLGAADAKVNTPDKRYPVGRSRMELLGVLACAVISAPAPEACARPGSSLPGPAHLTPLPAVIVASVEVIQFSVQDLVVGFRDKSKIEFINLIEYGGVMYIILVVGIVMKVRQPVPDRS